MMPLFPVEPLKNTTHTSPWIPLELAETTVDVTMYPCTFCEVNILHCDVTSCLIKLCEAQVKSMFSLSFFFHCKVIYT